MPIAATDWAELELEEQQDLWSFHHPPPALTGVGPEPELLHRGASSHRCCVSSLLS
jgi:hypothetical protein